MAIGKDKVLLFLDDERNPFLKEYQKYLPSVGYNKIVWVRNFNEFKSYLLENPQPKYISFDHDLAPEHYTPEIYWDNYQRSKRYQLLRYPNYKVKTGKHCAELYKEMNLTSQWFIHSANPVGADFIKDVLIQPQTKS